ncbi:cob(I)yrinic acid a,c-diamide adenosyltransferase [Ruminococcaceae bacterium OttesenSCG-928-L11]|nr:cob(I)yrinic acid a,c-diamide adenosyltransferase [Ruminococcaceae bacterium OttesenSCG-928-L11]
MKQTPPLEPAPQKIGLIHLYEGDGKGKTTAAVGLAVRAAGQGLQVLVCQLLKGMESGEVSALERLGIPVRRPMAGAKFLFQMSEAERREAAVLHRDCLTQVCRLADSGQVDLLVLDEILDAIGCGLIPEEQLTTWLSHRPAGVEVVLTGRDPSPAIQALADYHTRFQCVLHPYAAHIPARRGIEY